MNIAFRVARVSAKVTQERLAKETGVTQADISRIEKSGWIPPVEIRQRLADALDTTSAHLFDVNDISESHSHA